MLKEIEIELEPQKSNSDLKRILRLTFSPEKDIYTISLRRNRPRPDHQCIGATLEKEDIRRMSEFFLEAAQIGG